MSNLSNEQLVKNKVVEIIKAEFGTGIADTDIVLKNPPEHIKDFNLSVVVAPLLKLLGGKSPDEVGATLAKGLEKLDFVKRVAVAGIFVNISFSDDALTDKAQAVIEQILEQGEAYGHAQPHGEKVLIEYVSPNTNKPLHLGHVRNMAIGKSLTRLMSAAGYETIPSIIINDRGIHICKSMLAYQKWGEGKTPEDVGKKGDHFVGDYYVMFSNKFQEEYETWAKSKGFDPNDPPEGSGKNEFFNMPESKLGSEARKLLQLWEAEDEEVRVLWETMTDWVLAGLKESFQTFGIEFDKWYFESETFKLGKDIVEDGLERNVFSKEDDGSVQIDLGEHLGKKVLLRGDGTSVYVTQDLGLAKQRQEELGLSKMVYVVGVEQNYHFQVLFTILEKLGYEWVKGLHHFSYGWMMLPDGRMKSREGRVVDADDFLVGMQDLVDKKIADRDELSSEDRKKISHQVALGATNFYLLWSNPVQFITFNPDESLSFEGSTGPYIQYTATRIKSILRKLGDDIKFESDYSNLESEEEKELVDLLSQLPDKIEQSVEKYNISIMAHYVFDLSQKFNTFYHKYRVLDAPDEVKGARINLIKSVLIVLENSLYLLGIPVPERM